MATTNDNSMSLAGVSEQELAAHLLQRFDGNVEDTVQFLEEHHEQVVELIAKAKKRYSKASNFNLCFDSYEPSKTAQGATVTDPSRASQGTNKRTHSPPSASDADPKKYKSISESGSSGEETMANKISTERKPDSAVGRHEDHLRKYAYEMHCLAESHDKINCSKPGRCGFPLSLAVVDVYLLKSHFDFFARIQYGETILHNSLVTPVSDDDKSYLDEECLFLEFPITHKHWKQLERRPLRKAGGSAAEKESSPTHRAAVRTEGASIHRTSDRKGPHLSVVVTCVPNKDAQPRPNDFKLVYAAFCPLEPSPVDPVRESKLKCFKLEKVTAMNHHYPLSNYGSILGYVEGSILLSRDRRSATIQLLHTL